MARFCANCGTEVDDTAIFCPTCGQPIDEAAAAEIPAAPAWPAPDEGVAADRAQAEGAPEPGAGWTAPPPPATGEPAQTEARPMPPPAVPPSRPAPPAEARPGPAVNLPVTMPVTLSAWLIGIGAALAALGVVIGLFDGVLNPIELLLLVALVAIAASVFFSSSLPDIPNLRLATLVIVLIGFGIALDRLGFGGAGAGELLLFLGTAAAGIGAILLELGHDQPMGRAVG